MLLLLDRKFVLRCQKERKIVDPGWICGQASSLFVLETSDNFPSPATDTRRNASFITIQVIATASMPIHHLKTIITR
jgi:hypothetical protein